MGKLVKPMSRVFGAGILVLAGAGFLMLAGTGIANADPTSTACQKLTATVRSLEATLSTGHFTLTTSVPLITKEMTQAASTGSPALKSAVATYVADLKADEASGRINDAKLSADNSALVAACSEPVGAPATGGGSMAGVQDAALFGLGGAAVLAGVAVLFLASSNRIWTCRSRRA